MNAICLNQLFRCQTTDASLIRVCIPQIQRDYAEGRETDSVEKKRTNMLSDMLRAVYNNEALSLDFVYGNMEGQTFMPLDGQQRLTTLFVLHWLLGRNDDIKDSLGHSLFVYQTRKTSEEFCHWLVKQESNVILEKWHQEVIGAEKSNANNKELWNIPDENGKIDKIANRLKYPLVHVPTLFDYFMGMDDFKWDWHIDPNIRSMIVVIETAYKLINQQGTLDYVISQNKNLDNIKFEILKNLKCDGEELFEKMNARGKALSTYDLLKSSLEEELEIQKSSLSINRDWQNEIDNKWLYYCWDSSNIPFDPTLDDVKKVEEKLETLLIRMIGKTFFKQNILYKKPDDGTEVPGQSLEACIYKDCDNVAENYFKYARFERSKESFSTSSFSQLNLQEVYDDLNNLIYKDDTDGTYKDIARYLHDNGLRMHSANNNTLLDDFTSNGLGHETRVIFYAMMAYLKRCNAATLVGNPIEFANFKDWMRFTRNVFTSANKNVRIDKPDLVKSAISAIDKWLESFFATHHKGASNSEMLDFIANVIVSDANGQEQARLDEEAIKAKLRLGNYTNDNSKDWGNAIIDTEDDSYLWGQIIAPLKWSERNGLYNLCAFNQYMEKLIALIEESRKDGGLRLIQACLCLKDYRLNGNSNWGSLGTMTDDRDISWKRHLRDCDKNGNYGELLKRLIEIWKNQYNTLPCNQFLSNFIVANACLITDWRKYICMLPHTKLQALFNHVGTNKRYVNLDNGNIYLYRSTQPRSDAVRYELLTLYLYVSVNNSIQKRIEHVNGGAYLELTTTNNGIIRITSKTGGLYDVDVNSAALLNNVADTDVINWLRQLGVI